MAHGEPPIVEDASSLVPSFAEYVPSFVYALAIGSAEDVGLGSHPVLSVGTKFQPAAVTTVSCHGVI